MNKMQPKPLKSSLKNKAAQPQPTKAKIKLRTGKKIKVKEVELVSGSGIFNENDAALRYDMIDTKKAKSIVTALKYVKQ